LHLEHGVVLKCGAGVERLLYQGARAVDAILSDGKTISADVVLVAVGSQPATEWLQGSGLDLRDGVVCDACCQAPAHVHTAGDSASWPSARFGFRLRLEHQMNAVEQGMAAARNLLGADEAYDPVPFFWSDQYNVKIQVHGMIEPSTSCRILYGEPHAGSFVVGYINARNILRGVLGWNAAREVRKLRAQVGTTLEASTHARAVHVA